MVLDEFFRDCNYLIFSTSLHATLFFPVLSSFEKQPITPESRLSLMHGVNGFTPINSPDQEFGILETRIWDWFFILLLAAPLSSAASPALASISWGLSPTVLTG